MDWRASLESLRDTLPEGEEPAAEPSAVKGPKKDRLDIILDRKGRKGKVATIVAGFTVGDDEVAAVAATLKQKLGVGGSSRGGEILIQGDKRSQASDALVAMGYKVRII